MLEPSHGRVAASVLEFLTYMRNSISHPEYDFEGIQSHNPTKLLCLSPKLKCTRGISSLTGSSSHEELALPGTFLAQNVQPLPLDDSLGARKIPRMFCHPLR